MIRSKAKRPPRPQLNVCLQPGELDRFRRLVDDTGLTTVGAVRRAIALFEADVTRKRNGGAR